jgi:hypothetical protein
MGLPRGSAPEADAPASRRLFGWTPLLRKNRPRRAGERRERLPPPLAPCDDFGLRGPLLVAHRRQQAAQGRSGRGYANARLDRAKQAPHGGKLSGVAVGKIRRFVTGWRWLPIFLPWLCILNCVRFSLPRCKFSSLVLLRHIFHHSRSPDAGVCRIQLQLEKLHDMKDGMAELLDSWQRNRE